MRAHIRARSSTDFGNLINLSELGRSQSSWQNLAEFGQSVGLYLLSILPRHSYCNWASPVTYTKQVKSPKKPCESPLDHRINFLIKKVSNIRLRIYVCPLINSMV